MADADRPRFIKVFASRFCSDSLHIPISFYDKLPRPLPRSAILQGNGGCEWKVLMKRKHDVVHFTNGWSKFVQDNSLAHGDFMTFVYNGDCVFEVSVYDGRTKCSKVIRAADTEAEGPRANVILRSKNRGKSKVEETFSESKMPKAITSSRDKGKRKVVEESDEGDESDDEDYSPDSKDTASYMKNPKKKGKKKVVKESDEGDEPKTKRGKVGPFSVRPRIKDPERFLDDHNNPHFETILKKKRKHELNVEKATIGRYELEFEQNIQYMDKFGTLRAISKKLEFHLREEQSEGERCDSM